MNKNQIEVVRHYDNPALTAAGAGSGKTTILTCRIGYLICVKNVNPENILLLTFTKKASEEMIERVGKLSILKPGQANKITSGTFHSVFLKFLRENGETRNIWSSSRSKEICVKTILRTLKIDKFYHAEDVLAKISNYKNRMIGLENFPRSNPQEEEFYQIWSKYEDYKRSNNYIDFDDMLLNTYRLLQENQELLETLQEQFKFIVVDEGQDNNTIQFEIVKMIAAKYRNIMLIGDVNQVIYSFNGANIENILNFTKVYPDAKIINLDVNYRSTNHIVGLGTSIIKHASKTGNKKFYSVSKSDKKPIFIQPENVDEEANRIAREIKRSVNSGEKSYKDFAVLYRNNSNARAIYEEFLLQDVPFISYGSDEVFYDNYIVKPLVSYLKLSYDPKNMRAIEDVLPSLYLNKEKLKYIQSEEFINPISYPIEHVLSSGLSSYQAQKVRERLSMIRRIESVRPTVAISWLRDGYEFYLMGEENETTTTLQREIIKETIDELEQSAKRFSTNKEFIEFIEKISKNAKIHKELQKKQNLDSVKLMTIHRSKGLEFNHVFIIGATDNVIPHTTAQEECTDIFTVNVDMDHIEEERRLMYVAVTRSKQELCISAPRMYRNKPVEPSRFITEFLEA